ncbi:MAG TPA: hypothetical protein VFF67_01895 [Thermoplasmata archaeon]|nr:hypothetical protein [Thermoplasmata archaeon]
MGRAAFQSDRRRMIGIGTLGSAGGLALATFLMVLAPVAGAGVHNSIMIGAPYKGVSQPYMSNYQSGCGVIKTRVPTFNFSSGIGSLLTTGKASRCKGVTFGIGAYSSISGYGQLYTGVTFKVPKGTTHIAANVSATWNAALVATDGGHAQCSVNGNKYDDTYYSASWGYTKTQIGNYYADTNYSYWDMNYNGYTTAWSNGTGATPAKTPVPHPWNFNNTSSFTWSHSWGANFYCQSGAQVYAQAYSYMFDMANNSYIPQSANTAFVGGMFNMYVSVSNYTSWSCYNSTSWTGPSATWGNTSLTCSHNNGTVTSSWYSYSPKYTHGSSNNNSQTLSNVSTSSGMWFWNYTFTNLHKYIMIFYVYASGYAYNNWAGKGYATFLLNMATFGNGFRLVSINAS